MTGKNGSHWRHDWIPLNGAAAALKAHHSASTAAAVSQFKLAHHTPGKPAKPASLPAKPKSGGLLFKDTLRSASDEQLAAHYTKHVNNGNVRKQLESELNRRDRVERQPTPAERAISRKIARAEDVERRKQAAEAFTNGNTVNARGKRLGITDRQLLTQPSTARRYASDEMRAYLAHEAGSGRSDRQRRAA